MSAASPSSFHYLNDFDYDLCLQRVSLELVVADYDRIGSSDPIGRVEIGYNRRGGWQYSVSVLIICTRARAETLEGDGGEPQAPHCALACSQGESESSLIGAVPSPISFSSMRLQVSLNYLYSLAFLTTYRAA